MATFTVTFKAGIWLLFSIAVSMFSGTFSTVEEGTALTKLLTDWNKDLPTWIPGSDPCDGWENVLCTGRRVTALNLTNLGITGRLPEEIGVLSQLEDLDLSYNNFRGSLPNSLGLCQNMRVLVIQDCPWNTDFPTVITKLPRLEYLSLWRMKFEDSELPPKLSTLSKLQYFNCHDCNLTGGLPESYGELTDLIEFNVRANALTGAIPNSFKKLRNMVAFRVDNNAFLGPFPNWMFDYWPNLTSLLLSNNQFYGMPYNISYLETRFNLTYKMSFMRWDCNYVTGPEPCGRQGQNNCSELTLAYTQGGAGSSGKFSFDQNCWDNVYTNFSAIVGGEVCTGHPLTCEGFYSQVVNRKICPVCPTDQELLLNSTVDNGCLCEYTGSGGSGFPVKTTIGIVVGTLSLCLVLLVIYRRRRRTPFSPDPPSHSSEEKEDDELDGDWKTPVDVQSFSVEELCRITSGFSESQMIGFGGYGRVYSGELPDGRKVAVKLASAGSLQGSKQFRNEVNLLSRLHHRNLVRLEGYCNDKKYQALVYELMKEGNLATHLAAKGSPAKLGNKAEVETRGCLPWYKRVEIAFEVAQGLEYLHSFADPPVIHRDVKPSNILLDENMVAKLADFGLTKEFPELETHISTAPAGTAGYFDPEYFLRQQLTTASDVYAYGVVLLQLVTGQVAIDHRREDETNIIEWVKNRFFLRGIESIIDSKIAEEYSVEAFTKMTELALKCASFSKKDRPTMKEVLAALSPLIYPKKRKTSGSSSDSMDVTISALGTLHLQQLLNGQSDESSTSSGRVRSSSTNIMEFSQDFAPRSHGAVSTLHLSRFLSTFPGDILNSLTVLDSQNGH
ncbi:hypothetical protein AXG93_3096s1130 [Marchantia polymorpha subsp. ruderalis]|uniref:Protein kinase domain-containing protein n=1 Tax=Marchantia polymorpha subsp. ruderalis TaxID=1480154 RepID=A0A176W745_MARPO|nr:hypothetical protein AXG93_3096s1130 [Marchantia polymorpha subsp. ruderalis]